MGYEAVLAGVEMKRCSLDAGGACIGRMTGAYHGHDSACLGGQSDQGPFSARCAKGV